MNIKIYNVNPKIEGTNYRLFEFYFLPMFRYMGHGKNFKLLQFRWLVWGINWRIK